MNGDKPNSVNSFVPEAVRNELFYFVARLCMILATVIGLPISGFMLSRVVAKADEISSQVSNQSVDLKLLTQEFKSYVERSADHETRIRQLERIK